MPSPHAIAHAPIDAPTLLRSLLSFEAYPTLVLLCTTQANFLQDLLFTPTFDNCPPSESLLRPTLQALSIAPHISVVFTPTLSHLRAWLTVADHSSFATAAPTSPFTMLQTTHYDKQDNQKKNRQRSRLVVWNLVTSSCHTSEWSVQGLSETLATLIDWSHRMNCDIDLVEAFQPLTESLELPTEIIAVSEDEIMRDWSKGKEGEDWVAHDDGNSAAEDARAKNNIYHRRLPMLNGSSRRVGLNESAAWSGRTVEVGVVLRRWFKFAASSG